MEMTTTRERIGVRLAQEIDRKQLANLIHFSPWVHRHLDWRPPLDWIGYQPYLLVERDSRLLAALACPPDPPDTAWLRLFAVSSELTTDEAWEILWPAAHEYLWGITIAAIPLQGWFSQLLSAAQFTQTHEVFMMIWKNQELPA